MQDIFLHSSKRSFSIFSSYRPRHVRCLFMNTIEEGIADGEENIVYGKKIKGWARKDNCL